jgi:hypothetical protein
VLNSKLPEQCAKQYLNPSKKTNTSAIWAPNSGAFLCDAHAAQGYTINVELIPAQTMTITTNVSVGGQVETRTTPIVNTN